MGDMGGIADQAERAGRQAENSDWLDHAVRIGMVAYGIVNLMIAWIAAELALGNSSGKASSQGALHKLAQQPFGGTLVWLVAFGMVLLVIWRLLEAALGHRDEEGSKRMRKRAVSAGKAAIYGAVGISAFKVATGSGSSGKGGQSTTSKIMDWPGGTWIIGLVGVAIVAYGLNNIRRAWTEKFREHLSAEGQGGDAGKAYIWFGKIGYMAKGAAFIVIGGLFVYAATSHKPKKAGGLDDALHKVLQQPYGPVLLMVIAAGIACYGLFCFARARHLSR